MKRLLALLLLSGCNSGEPADVGEEPDAAPAVADIGNTLAADPETLQARVDAAMRAALQDADGAGYRNVRAGVSNTICGEVDPGRKGGGHAGFRPFLVTPEGAAIVARGPRL